MLLAFCHRFLLHGSFSFPAVSRRWYRSPRRSFLLSFQREVCAVSSPAITAAAAAGERQQEHRSYSGMSYSLLVGGKKPISGDSLAEFAFGSGAVGLEDEKPPCSDLTNGSSSSISKGGVLLPIADVRQCLATVSLSPLSVGQLPQPHAPLSRAAARAVALLRLVSLHKSGVSLPLLRGLCAVCSSAGESSFSVPRCGHGGSAEQPSPALVSLLCAAAEAAGLETLRLEDVSLFLTDAPEVAARLYISSRCYDAAAKLATCCAAASSEVLLLPSESLADIRKQLAAAPGLAEVSEHLAVLLHDSKLQQHRRAAAECSAALSAFFEVAGAVGALRVPLQTVLSLAETALKKQINKPKGFAVAAAAAAAADNSHAAAQAALAAAAAAAATLEMPLSGQVSPFSAAAGALEIAARVLLQAELKLLQKTLQAALLQQQQQQQQHQQEMSLPDALASDQEYFGAAGGDARLSAEGTAAAAAAIKQLLLSAEEVQRRPAAAAAGSVLECISRLEDIGLLLQQALGLHAALLLQCIEERDVQVLRESAAKIAKGKKGASTRWAVTAGVREFVSLLRKTAVSLSPSLCPNAAVAAAGVCFSQSPSFANAAAAGSFGASLSSLLLPSNVLRRVPKVAKGTQDFSPERMFVRDTILETIIGCFQRHGAQPIDTPVFELRETLLGKYGGEASKLVFELKDQGGEQLCLRYDLTVPFARYVAAHSLSKMRRYHIGKVYRRDEPQMNRGRFREFYQCDFDVAGELSPPLLADAECLCLLCEILSLLKGITGDFLIKINSRLLLDGLMAFSGVKPENFCTVCSSIDKLDKEPWAAVAAELEETKGIAAEVVERLGAYVQQRGSVREMLQRLQQDAKLMAQAPAAAAARDFSQLLIYLEAFAIEKHLSWDWSLARGLDYYTGIIFEAVLVSEDGSSSGSIAGGGRYDNLVGLFSSKQLPAVGFSVGVERLFALMEARLGMDSSSSGSSGSGSGSGVRRDFTDVLVCSLGDAMLPVALSSASRLWRGGIRCELFYGEGVRLKKQLDFASAKQIPFVVICAENEHARQAVRVKRLTHQHQQQQQQQQQQQEQQIDEEVPLKDLVEFLKKHMGESVFHKYKKAILATNNQIDA